MDIDGDPWFVARDICYAIDVYRGRRSGAPNVTMLCQKLAPDETQFNRIELSTNGPRRVVLVSESGLYKLVMRSDKPEAKAFQDWVSREVLPSILAPHTARTRPVQRALRVLATGEGGSASVAPRPS